MFGDPSGLTAFTIFSLFQIAVAPFILSVGNIDSLSDLVKSLSFGKMILEKRGTYANEKGTCGALGWEKGTYKEEKAHIGTHAEVKGTRPWIEGLKGGRKGTCGNNKGTCEIEKGAGGNK